MEPDTLTLVVSKLAENCKTGYLITDSDIEELLSACVDALYGEAPAKELYIKYENEPAPVVYAQDGNSWTYKDPAYKDMLKEALSKFLKIEEKPPLTPEEELMEVEADITILIEDLAKANEKWNKLRYD
jgi:hypothetical protein